MEVVELAEICHMRNRAAVLFRWRSFFSWLCCNIL